MYHPIIHPLLAKMFENGYFHCFWSKKWLFLLAILIVALSVLKFQTCKVSVLYRYQLLRPGGYQYRIGIEQVVSKTFILRVLVNLYSYTLYLQECCLSLSIFLFEFRALARLCLFTLYYWFQRTEVRWSWSAEVSQVS